MLPVIVTSVALMLVLAASSAVTPLKASVTALKKPHAEGSVSAVREAVENYYLDNFALPSALDELSSDGRYLAATPYGPATFDAEGAPTGNSQVYLKTWTTPATNTYSSSFPLYKRTLIIAPVGASASLARLTYLPGASEFPEGCSNGVEFSAAHPDGCQDWSRSVGAIVSEEALYPHIAKQVAQRQESTAMLISKRYQEITKGLATPPGDALRGVIGTATTLRDYATPFTHVDFNNGNVGVTYAQCTGIFKVFNGAPTPNYGADMACNDLYNYYGKPVTYKKLSLDSFELVSDSAFKRSNGAFRKVVTTVVHTLSTPAVSPRTVSISTVES